MNENQLHSLYAFLTDKFAGVDARFDAIDARFDENEIIQNEILNEIGKRMDKTDAILRNHQKRIIALETQKA